MVIWTLAAAVLIDYYLDPLRACCRQAVGPALGGMAKLGGHLVVGQARIRRQIPGATCPLAPTWLGSCWTPPTLPSTGNHHHDPEPSPPQPFLLQTQHLLLLLVAPWYCPPCASLCSGAPRCAPPPRWHVSSAHQHGGLAQTITKHSSLAT